ncbi:MAG: hypothetical protein H6739_29550 [Alphaproteobacteria bacterium]|nr:hypothetical protein [Alphaproteobacteria bacterium]
MICLALTLASALSSAGNADVIPVGERSVESVVVFEGLDAHRGSRFLLYPEGPSFDGVEWLEPDEDGRITSRFYAASPPWLFAIPKEQRAAAQPALLEGPGRGCAERCEPPADCSALCELSPAAYFEALGWARSALPLQRPTSVPKASDLARIEVIVTVEGVERGVVALSVDHRALTEAEVGQQEADVEALERGAQEEYEALLKGRRRAQLARRALLGLTLVLGVGFLMRRSRG